LDFIVGEVEIRRERGGSREMNGEAVEGECVGAGKRA
jgi:hypothetical protein